MDKLVIIKGSGDIATGVAHRLLRCGFKVLMTELDQPTVVRRTVAFAEAVYSGEVIIEGVRAVKTEFDGIEDIMNSGSIPVVVDPYCKCMSQFSCMAVVDAIVNKKGSGMRLCEAPIVIGVGPGFMAGRDVHAVIETMRGHDLGRVLYEGNAMPNTGIPGEIGGFTTERVLRAPDKGIFYGTKKIGDSVERNDELGEVNGKTVRATISGILRGLLHDGLFVTAGMKIGDIDPRCRKQHCFTISDKARAVGGGVLEAILTLHEMLRTGKQKIHDNAEAASLLRNK